MPIFNLGNSGQGKSYLLKLILENLRESGMNVCALDPEMEYEDLTNNLGGCFIDLMSGEFIINVLEPKTWDENGSPEDKDAPQTFRISSKLSQHISFLKGFFRTYKDFSDREIDTIEIMLQKLYAKFGISDSSGFDRLTARIIHSVRFVWLIEENTRPMMRAAATLYRRAAPEYPAGAAFHLQRCRSKFFDGHTNITDSALSPLV